MDVVAVIIFIFTTTVGLNQELKREVDTLDAKIEQVDNNFLRLSGSHAATSARDIVNHENQEAEIERLSKEIESLNNKLNEYSTKINQK